MTILDMLRRLIACNSISSVNADIDQGNRDVIDILANWLDDLGFHTEIMSLAHPRKANLIATLGSGPGGLVLAGHTDTVPCDDKLWRQSPFELTERDNRFYGLGVCDMKGFFPLAIEAAKQFTARPLQQPLIILATADEESSMAGARALAMAGKPKARYAIIGEPTGMKPVAMHKGILIEKLVIHGRSGHSSNPALGNNAMHTMHDAISVLRTMQAELKERYTNPLFAVDYPTLNLGFIHGGDNPNRICGHCELGFEIRPLPGMNIDELHAMITQRLSGLGEKEGTELSLQHFGVPAFAADEQSELLAYCEKLTGHSRGSVAFATEAPYLQQLGMDVLVMGPGNIDQAHQPDEYLATERIEPTVKHLVQLIEKYCL
ncbi:MAG: acetylornithine deacetylase [Gammaproteobacteria bacterium]|nr:MAG: acetylornithine deacetylase [Gammaproteobacteria bacterium]RLA42466.1 MAG: acetylornithine deacetylase [Gammaproteobacteria bacterium]